MNFKQFLNESNKGEEIYSEDDVYEIVQRVRDESDIGEFNKEDYAAFLKKKYKVSYDSKKNEFTGDYKATMLNGLFSEEDLAIYKLQFKMDGSKIIEELEEMANVLIDESYRRAEEDED